MAQLALSFAKRSITGIANALAGNAIASLFASDRVVGPKLDQLHILQSIEGAPMPIVFGRVRIGGQVIWADQPTEHRDQVQSGGKGGGASTTERKYSLSFAVGLCEGVIDGVGRVWADGKLLNSGQILFRTHTGEEEQLPDSLIQAVETVAQTPAFKGLAYVVFEDFPLTEYGNRIPQLSFEVFRSPLELNEQTSLKQRLKGVTLIPGSGEFAYATEPVLADHGPGVTRVENANNSVGGTDILAALDNLQRDLPACKTISLVVSWFGTDLRCANCELYPGVESVDKVTIDQEWQVGAIKRQDAHLVSMIDDRPAFGGTPSDCSIIQTITEIKARGFRVVFYPFILMDIPAGNGLPDPYGNAEQAVFPWRGRITCHPAPLTTGSPDKSIGIQAQVDSFFGNAAIADFQAETETISYSGPQEWSFRRMVLHYAKLCQLAGGVDGFLIGSELPGLTRLRSSQDQYPVVEKLRLLAQDVNSVLPSAEISYAADWSEYFGHQPQDGTGDVYFHLDPLWADPAIDFVGIDWYVPLSDWRDGAGHLDAAQFESIHDPAYLLLNNEGGEGYDWYYASSEDRDAQTRLAITDGAYAKDWVFRYKDIKNWWGQSHFNRPNGVENSTATAWVAESKPVWFTETGCPAADKGANQPNVFYDPKSSESFLPYFSSGQRDDLIQRRYCEAILDHWQIGNPGNPVSSVYGGPMIDPDDIQFWTWDARPFPDFPSRSEVWSDGDNWQLGHWLNGRVGFSSLSAIVTDLCGRANITDFITSSLEGVVTGYAIQGGVTVRQALAPLGDCYGFELTDRFGTLSFSMPALSPVVTHWNQDSLAKMGDRFDANYQIGDAEEQINGVQIQFANDENDYQPAHANIHVESINAERLIALSIPLVADPPSMKRLGNAMLARLRDNATNVRLALPPSQLGYEVGDIVTLDPGFLPGRWQIRGVEEQTRREILLSTIESIAVIATSGANPGFRGGIGIEQVSRPALAVLDIPLLPGESERLGPRVAAYAWPWQGSVEIRIEGDQRVRAVLQRPAIIGTVIQPVIAGGFSSRFDLGMKLHINMGSANLLSIQMMDILAGANSLAVQHEDSSWEILQFQLAELQPDGSWFVSHLLRGQSGTEGAFNQPIPVGSQVVLLDGSSQFASVNEYELGVELNWRGNIDGSLVPSSQQAKIRAMYRDHSRLPRMPVHLKVKENAGDIVVSWIRRTRVGGDNWFSPEVPLAESREQYLFTLFVLDVPVLSELVDQPQRTLSTAELAGYFPSGLPTELDIAIAQVSAEAGPGATNRQMIAI